MAEFPRTQAETIVLARYRRRSGVPLALARCTPGFNVRRLRRQ